MAVTVVWYILPMEAPQTNAARPSFFEYHKPAGLRFSKSVIEVTISDRHGHPVWQARLGPQDHPVWDGRDRFGVLADAGTYLCRIRDQKGETFYVPFVLIR